jgi:hypothetical protein
MVNRLYYWIIAPKGSTPVPGQRLTAPVQAHLLIDRLPDPRAVARVLRLTKQVVQKISIKVRGAQDEQPEALLQGVLEQLHRSDREDDLLEQEENGFSCRKCSTTRTSMSRPKVCFPTRSRS